MVNREINSKVHCGGSVGLAVFEQMVVGFIDLKKAVSQGKALDVGHLSR